MSRSYKKNPFVTDHRRGTTKELKRLANRTFRRKISCDEDMPARPAHRKYTETWNIHDYISRWSWKQAKEEYNNPIYTWKNKYPTLEEFYKFWTKYYKRK